MWNMITHICTNIVKHNNTIVKFSKMLVNIIIYINNDWCFNPQEWQVFNPGVNILLYVCVLLNIVKSIKHIKQYQSIVKALSKKKQLLVNIIKPMLSNIVKSIKHT